MGVFKKLNGSILLSSINLTINSEVPNNLDEKPLHMMIDLKDHCYHSYYQQSDNSNKPWEVPLTIFWP